MQCVDSTADRNINPNPRFGSTESSPSPKPKGEQTIMQETPNSGKCFLHNGFRFPKEIASPTLAPAAVAWRCSVTIEAMSSSSDSGGEPRKPGESRLSQSSTLVAAAPLKPSGTTELHATPLRPGEAARRLLAEDEKSDRGELFRHLPETHSLSHRLRRHGW